MQVVVNTTSGPTAVVEGVFEFNVEVGVSPVLNITTEIQGIQGPQGPQGPAGGGGISSPTIPAFEDQTDVAIDTLTESNAVTVAGDAETVWPAVVRGDGSPEIRVNSGPWGPSGIFRAGDSLRLRLMSSGDALAARIATLYAQGVAIDWSVTTAGGGLLFVPLGSDALITSDGLTFRVAG